MQMLKAYNILCKGLEPYYSFQETNYREEIGDLIFNKILTGQFDARRGNLVAMFAESMNLSNEQNTKDPVEMLRPLGMFR